MRRYTLEIGGREFVVDVGELDADRFQVRVGGEAYEVTLSGDEDLPKAAITPGLAPAAGVTAPATPAASPARPAFAAAAQRPASGGSSTTLNAPMPGVILEIAVKPGDSVARGQQVAVLEAMKMNNSIRSPRAGTIAEVCVGAGQAVGHGDAILRFRED
jgi:biotin carboxyl carrier protein